MGNITNPEYQKQFEADFSAEPPRKKRKTNPNSATQEDYAFTSSQTKSGLTVGVTIVEQSQENIDPDIAEALGVKELKRLPHIAYRATKLLPNEDFRVQARTFAALITSGNPLWSGKSSFHDLLTCSEYARDFLFGETDVWDWKEESIPAFLKELSNRFQRKPRPNKAFGFLLPLRLKDEKFSTVSETDNFNFMILIIANSRFFHDSVDKSGSSEFSSGSLHSFETKTMFIELNLKSF